MMLRNRLCFDVTIRVECVDLPGRNAPAGRPLCGTPPPDDIRWLGKG
jgi:hypothetical protein